MAKWTAFPFAGEYNFDAVSVKKKWAKLQESVKKKLLRLLLT